MDERLRTSELDGEGTDCVAHGRARTVTASTLVAYVRWSATTVTEGEVSTCLPLSGTELLLTVGADRSPLRLNLFAEQGPS